MARNSDIFSRVGALLHLSNERTEQIREATLDARYVATNRLDEALVRVSDVARRLHHATNETVAVAKTTFIREYHRE